MVLEINVIFSYKPPYPEMVDLGYAKIIRQPSKLSYLMMPRNKAHTATTQWREKPRISTKFKSNLLDWVQEATMGCRYFIMKCPISTKLGPAHSSLCVDFIESLFAKIRWIFYEILHFEYKVFDFRQKNCMRVPNSRSHNSFPKHHFW